MVDGGGMSRWRDFGGSDTSRRGSTFKVGEDRREEGRIGGRVVYIPSCHSFGALKYCRPWRKSWTCQCQLDSGPVGGERSRCIFKGKLKFCLTDGSPLESAWNSMARVDLGFLEAGQHTTYLQMIFTVFQQVHEVLALQFLKMKWIWHFSTPVILPKEMTKIVLMG
jgi:hypothetical protein